MGRGYPIAGGGLPNSSVKKQKKEPVGLLKIEANESPDYIGQVGKTWEEVDETAKQFFPITIRGIECHALVDSGNLFRTCISEQLMNKLGVQKKDLIELTQAVGTEYVEDSTYSRRITSPTSYPIG